MWLIANKTPFTSDFAWVRDQRDNKQWLVVVKGTFGIKADGRCVLAAQQQPVRQMAEPFGEFGLSSLRYESDLFGVKPTTDVLVVGDAISPRGRPVTSLNIALQCASINKTLRVIGDRVWAPGAVGAHQPSAPRPFVRMPIVFERAFGGWDRSSDDEQQHRLAERNPVGTGFCVRRENCGGLALPNIEYPDDFVRAWSDRPTPAGLNVVDCSWSPRRELAGTYDERWRRERFPSWATDFNPHYNNCAPIDQQTSEYLRGGELIEVRNMSDAGILRFQIPRIQLAFRTRFGAARVDHEGQLCTVLVEPNIPRVALVWQSFLVCNRGEDQLDETLVVESRGSVDDSRLSVA